jgi:hypothetical protein
MVVLHKSEMALVDKAQWVVVVVFRYGAQTPEVATLVLVALRQVPLLDLLGVVAVREGEAAMQRQRLLTTIIILLLVVTLLQMGLIEPQPVAHHRDLPKQT